MQQVHQLKTLGRYFDAVVRGDKTFEVRKNDRAFQTGDILELARLDDDGRHYSILPGDRYEKITARYKITYLLQGGQFGIEPGYCVLGLSPVPKTTEGGE